MTDLGSLSGEQPNTIKPPFPLPCPDFTWYELCSYQDWYKPREACDPLPGMYRLYKAPRQNAARSKRTAAEAGVEAVAQDAESRPKRAKTVSLSVPRRSPRVADTNAAQAAGGSSISSRNEPTIGIIIEKEEVPLTCATQGAVDSAAADPSVPAPVSTPVPAAGGASTCRNKKRTQRTSRLKKGTRASPRTPSKNKTSPAPAPRPSPGTIRIPARPPRALVDGSNLVPPLLVLDTRCASPRASASVSPTPTALSLPPSESPTRVNSPAPASPTTMKIALVEVEEEAPVRTVRFSTSSNVYRLRLRG